METIEFDSDWMRNYRGEVLRHLAALRFQIYIWNLATWQGCEIMTDIGHINILLNMMSKHTIHCIRESRRLYIRSRYKVLGVSTDDSEGDMFDSGNE